MSSGAASGLSAEDQAALLRDIADIRAGLLQDLAALSRDPDALWADGVRALAPISAQLDALLAESDESRE